MKDLVKFLFFIIYSTVVFFIPNGYPLFIPVLVNICLMISCLFFTYVYEKYTKNYNKYNALSIFSTTLKIMPFVIFTFVINCILDTYINAFFVGLKLLIVCNATVIYSFTTTAVKTAKTVELLCSPLKLFKINTEEIFILVCISLSMIPIIKNELIEIKNSCKAKGMTFNVKNSKYILSKFFYSLLMRVNEIESSLISKGYNF